MNDDLEFGKCEVCGWVHLMVNDESAPENCFHCNLTNDNIKPCKESDAPLGATIQAVLKPDDWGLDDVASIPKLPETVENYFANLLLCKHPQEVMEKDDYPSWICSECAEANGGRWPKGHVATFHNGTCGWCNQTAGVTEPRDWCYPKFNKKCDVK